MGKNDAKDWIFLTISGVIWLILYVLLFYRYVPYDIDLAWTTSWIYEFIEKGNVGDPVFLRTSGGVSVGTVLNYKGFVYFYGSFMQIFGWHNMLETGKFLSLFWSFITLLIWYFVAKLLLNNHKKAIFFSLALVFSEPFIAMTQKIRVEPVGMFFIGLTLLLIIKEQTFSACFVGGISFETHPAIAVTSYGYIFAYILANPKVFFPDVKTFWKQCFFGALGLVLGFGIYIVLYWNMLNSLISYTTGLQESTNFGGYLSRYFFESKMTYRHLPEGILFIFTVICYLTKKQFKIYPVYLYFIIAIIVTALILKRGNHHYMIYAEPAFLLMIFAILPLKFKKIYISPMSFCLFWMLYLVPQFLLVAFVINTPSKIWDFPKYRAELRVLIPEKNSLIFTSEMNDWFSVYESEMRDIIFHKKYNLAEEAQKHPVYFVLHTRVTAQNNQVSLDTFTNEIQYVLNDLQKQSYFIEQYDLDIANEPVKIIKLIKQ
jgi:hypothetical protein